MTLMAKVRGKKGDALIGRLPDKSAYITFTTAEVENNVVKEFPVCPDIEVGDVSGVIEIVEIYEKLDEEEKSTKEEKDVEKPTTRNEVSRPKSANRRKASKPSGKSASETD